MSIKKYIPNLITCFNLVLGCFTIIAIFESNLENIIYYVLLACGFDFFDGFVARILKITSPIGKDLDSLADMITFGIVPSLLMFVMIKNNTTIKLLPYVAILIAVCSGIRLAKFNNDERQSDAFYGLPTPANALVLCSLPLVSHGLPVLKNLLQNDFFLLSIVVLLSILLVSDMRLLTLKFKNFSWKNNELRYLLIIFSIALFLYLKMISIPFIIIFYFLVSIFINVFAKN